MSEPRPNTMTPAIAERVARTIASAIVKSGCVDDGDVDALAKDIVRVARPWMDGYEIAKELDDRLFWSVSFPIAEELDRFHSMVAAEVRAAEKEWAARTKPQPAFSPGDRIRLKNRQAETGTIDEIGKPPLYAAQYLVQIDGDPLALTSARQRRVVNFEDAEALNGVPPA